MVEFLHFDIQSTGQKSHCVNTFSGHHNALFLLNSRIPLVRFSSESVVCCKRLHSVSARHHFGDLHPLNSSLPTHCAPTCPTLRANPFPEVTDLSCRIPLSTFFYRPEAANLGDLMRLLVRPAVPIILLLRFSWIVMNAPDAPNAGTLCLVRSLASG